MLWQFFSIKLHKDSLMKKSELLNWFQEEYQRWELLLAAIG